MSDHHSITRMRRIGPFEIVRELGRGGSARVFLVRDPENKVNQPQGVYALKAIPNDAEDRNRFLVRFHQEFAMIKRLNHPHIIQTFIASQTDDVVYYVMEYVPGGTFRDLMRGQPLPVAAAVDCAVQMALALGHAHNHGIIHRDVKPSNILVRAQNEDPRRLVLTDFGTAKIIGERGVTKSGMTIGTPEYMAPEQAEGHDDLDGRADIYALGCVLFEALAGQTPFVGTSAVSILFQHVHASLPILRGFNSEVPEGLAAVVEKMLAKRPEDRYAHAEEVVDSLNPFLGDRFAADIPTLRMDPTDDAVGANGSINGSVNGPIFVTEVPAPLAPPDLPTLPPSISALETQPPTAQFDATGLSTSVTDLETRPPQFSGASVFGIGAGPSGPRGMPGTPPGIGPTTPGGPYSLLPPGVAPGPLPVPGRGPVSGGQPGGRGGTLPGMLPPLPGPPSGPAPRSGGAVPPGPRTTRRLDDVPGGRVPGGTLRPGMPGYGEPQGRYTARPAARSTQRPRNRTGIGGASTGTRRLTRPIEEPYARSRIAVADVDGSWLLPSEPKRRKRPRSALTIPALVLAALLVVAGGGIAAFALGGGTSNTSTPQNTPITSTATAKTTTTATTSPTATTTVTASTTNANASAAASFRAVTVDTGIDGSCASASQKTTFAAGQAIYVNLCTAQSIAGPMTVTLEQNGEVVYTFQAGKVVSANSHFYYFVQRGYAAGTYDVVVTMQVNGQTGTARTIPLTIQ